MGQITSLFARKVVAQVDGPVTAASLLGLVGLSPDAEVDPSRMIDAADYYRLFEAAAAADRDPTTLPLRVGASMRSDDYGPFGFAWKAAPTLQGSFERAVRHALVLTSVAGYELEPAPDGAFLHLRRAGDRHLGMRLSNEATLASILAISREVSTAPFHPVAVYLQHPAPRTTAAHEAHFGCPVHFDSDRDALLVSHHALRAPNRVGDASIARFFDTHLEATRQEAEAPPSLARQVIDRIATALSGGVPSLSAVARELAMSGRTLQRRLASEGHTFQGLVDAARERLARRLLQQRDEVTLSEVTYMTGFADQSAFTRAFRRWTGETPGAFRASGRGGGGR